MNQVIGMTLAQLFYKLPNYLDNLQKAKTNILVQHVSMLKFYLAINQLNKWINKQTHKLTMELVENLTSW